jgi:hypothetical protein
MLSQFRVNRDVRHRSFGVCLWQLLLLSRVHLPSWMDHRKVTQRGPFLWVDDEYWRVSVSLLPEVSHHASLVHQTARSICVQGLDPDTDHISGLAWSYAGYAPYHQCAVTTIPGNVLYNVTLTDAGLSYASLSISAVTSAVVSCDGIPILYDQADLASFQRVLSTRTSSSQSQTSSISKMSSIPPPTGTPSGNSGPTGSKGLSSGAKAGMAIAAVLVVFAIFLFLFLFIRRHRKQQATQRSEHAATSTAEADGKGVVVSELPTSANKHELPSPYHQNQELESPDNRAKYSMGHELHAPVPSELGSYGPPSGPIAQESSASNLRSPVSHKAVPTEIAKDDDPELERMKAEIEALRVEKQRRLQDLEGRERELSRAIVAKSRTEMRGNLG